jgi:hypothetical protein
MMIFLLRNHAKITYNICGKNNLFASIKIVVGRPPPPNRAGIGRLNIGRLVNLVLEVLWLFGMEEVMALETRSGVYAKKIIARGKGKDC